LWLLVGLLLLCLFLCAVLIERQPSAWDALGYQVAGRNIVRGIGPAIEHPLNEELGPYFTLAAFAGQSPRRPSRLYLNYPPGLPLLLAIPQWAGLPSFLVLPVLSTMSVLFTYLLGSLLLDRPAGVLGAAVVAFTPVFLEWGTSIWADLPGTCFMLGALAAYVAAWRKKSRARRVVLGGLSGTLVVIATFIKYSNVLILLPLFAYGLYVQRLRILHSTINWVLVAAVILGLAGVGLYNYAIYGNPLETHYSTSRSGYSFPIFSLSYALGPSPADGYSLIGAAKTLWENFSWLLVLAVLGLARAPRRAGVLLGTLFLIYLGMSSTFAWAPVNEDTRYLLPLFAPVGLFAAWGCLSIRDLAVSWKKWALGIALLALAVTSLSSIPTSWHHLQQRNRAGLSFLGEMQSLTDGSQPDAVFLAYLWNDPINYFGGRTTLFYRRMNFLDRAEFTDELTRVVTALLQDSRPVYYVVDRQPSFADSLEILRQHFHLRLWKEEPIPVYEVLLPK